MNSYTMALAAFTIVLAGVALFVEGASSLWPIVAIGVMLTLATGAVVTAARERA